MEEKIVKKVNQLIREMRGSTQQQALAEQLHISRESISKYENERVKIPVDISKKLMEKFNNPQFAITLCQEYTGTGPICLDGENIDFHRASLKEHTMITIKEALKILETINFSKPFSQISPCEENEIQQLLMRLTEAQTAIANLIVVICDEANISYLDVWQRHYEALKKAGYVRGEAM